MRVLLANKFFRPGAGAETAFLATRDLLLEAGHEVIDFAMAAPDNLPSPNAEHFAPTRDYAQDSTLRRARDGLASVYSFAARRAIAELIAETRPDVAHLHNVYHQLTLSLVDELARSGVPSVMTLHDYKIVCPSYTLFTEGRPCRRCVTGTPLHAIAHRCVKDSTAASTLAAVETGLARLRRSYRKLDALIAPSRFLGELAKTRASVDRVHVLPNFLRVDRMPDVVNGRKRDSTIVFAGRLERVKGIEPLLEAFAGDGATGLTIAGDGPLRELVAQAAAANPRISYLGRLEQPALEQMMRAALAVIVPSLWEENCPMTVLEARVAGTPVICADSGGLPELVDDGVDGLLCDPTRPASIAAAVERLASDRGAIVTMGQAGQRRFVERHGPAAHLAGLTEIYESAAVSRSTR